jgi:hypothetical protein
MEIDLRLNRPQCRAQSVLFKPDGTVNRGVTVFLGWGRGVGKSWYRRQVWWLLVAAFDYKLRSEALEPFRGVRITSLAPTLKQWKDIHWGGITEELTGSGKWAWLGAKLDSQTGQVRFPGGSTIRPFPASAYNARTARGMRTDVLDADEVDDIDADVYDGVAVPWLSEPWSLGIELPGGTPTRGRHGLFWRNLSAGKLGQKLRDGARPEDVRSAEDIERFRALSSDEDAGLDEVVEALKSIHAIHATYRDAPETVSKRAVARAAATTPPATFKREWEADPDAGEGLVYPFDEAFHVQEPPPLESFREFHVGMDHGWVDAGVLLLGGIQGHGEDATIWLLDEHYESQCPNGVWDERAAAWGFAKFWPDPSRPDRINDLRSAGLKVGEVDNNILGGIARVAELMFIRPHESGERWSRLYISPKCKNLIAELGKYRRKKLPDGTFDEMPEDKWNHACDALRYMVVGRFGRAPNYKTVTSGR